MIALSLLFQAMAAPVPPRGVGAYEFLACERACGPADSALVIARGVLVLDTARIGPMFQAEGSTGCFDLKVRKHNRSYLALFSPSYTSWRLRGDTLEFDTYHSPDAYHKVTVVLTDSGFVGWGRSGGAGVAEIHVPDEYIVGRRIGPPTSGTCRVPLPRRSDNGVNVRSVTLFALIGGGFAWLLSRIP